MFAENEKISLRQLQALLLLDCFGTAVLFLPMELARREGQACWLTAILCGLTFALLSLLLTSAGMRQPQGTVVEWCRGAFGNVLGSLILLGLALTLLFDGAMELRLLGEIICRAMLPTTPVWVILLVILAVAWALAAQGIECRGRTAELLFFFVAVPMVLVLAAVAISAEYRHILPLAAPSFTGYRSGLPAYGIVFQGLLFLYFVFPYLKKPQRARRSVLCTTLISAVVLTTLVFLCLAAYGAGMLSRKLLPALQVMERVSFTGLFLTRQDVLLLWFWMASVSMFLSGVFFFGSLLGTRAFRQKNTARKGWLGAIFVILLAAALFPENLSAAYALRLRISPWLHGIYLLLLPILLLLFAGRGGKRDA